MSFCIHQENTHRVVISKLLTIHELSERDVSCSYLILVFKVKNYFSLLKIIFCFFSYIFLGEYIQLPLQLDDSLLDEVLQLPAFDLVTDEVKWFLYIFFLN